MVLGPLPGCFKEEFMLGAVCRNEVNCGENESLCCSGTRCRPSPELCDRGATMDTSYEYAYRDCQHDDDCIAYGMLHCVRLEGAEAGFCTDLCQGISDNCEKHPDSDSRTCLDIDGQKLCALRCCSAGCEADTDGSICPGQGECPAACPGTMECLADVCVPKADS